MQEQRKYSWFQKLIRYLFWPNRGRPQNLKVTLITDDLGKAKVRQNQNNYLRVIRKKHNRDLL